MESQHTYALASQPASGVAPAELLPPEQAAQVLGLSVKTLAAWRSTGRNALPFIRCGSRIRYRRADLAAWLLARQSTSTADAVKGAAR
ncbi:helix-turn-helix domain-containing protein [Pseudomonas sp. Gutcm_11s]|uniref:helix-turn-helix domain-containing protein n=1 Tax=Pseudomonas sp. Gutcm_11s TaxID=3026088 RepID=UPI002360098E|nr:helix-turn-helix domain-containing protein [Pseudomonas sp. Gutcm_11s]MDD0843363.1 helix-turn-helix domain-containing protein [Pseudomonas sp. Gutcm_11s]